MLPLKILLSVDIILKGLDVDCKKFVVEVCGKMSEILAKGVNLLANLKRSKMVKMKITTINNFLGVFIILRKTIESKASDNKKGNIRFLSAIRTGFKSWTLGKKSLPR